jgi:predicted membrane-bound spermidine synthase
MAVLLLFFCSGATALVYEVLWSKYLALLFGSTIQAQTLVLAIFMGGLALGNRVFGNWADRLRKPLAVYGYLEGAVGLYAFFFCYLYKIGDDLFSAVGSKLLNHGLWLLLIKGLISGALLLGPTTLMGGTLPLLAGWLQKRNSDAGRCAAAFYSINSLGAVCGAGLAGFFLVTWLGLPMTLQMTGLVNVLIGLTALILSRPGTPTPSPVSSTASTPKAEQTDSASERTVFRWACFLVTLTGSVSMGLEVLASRCLVMIFGASLQAFAIVLMAFILGIGIGSAFIASRGANLRRKDLITIGLVLAAAVWIGLIVFNIEHLAAVYLYARSGLASTSVGYRYNQLIAAFFSILMLGLPAGAIGAVLPLWIRIVSESSSQLGDRVGRLLTWNTLGAVGGVLLTGFVLMPQLGLRGSFAALALVLSGAALFVTCATGRRLAAVSALAVCGLLVFVAATGAQNWRQVLSAGVFRFHGGRVSPALIKSLAAGRLLYYEDAADATVSVVESEGRGLRVNGKPDASTGFDLSTQLLLAHVPMMAKPDSKDVFVFGLGSGITAGAVLGYPVERLVIAENCEPVIRAARFFEPWNNGVLTNARVQLCREDARTVLKLNPQRYDVVIAEPSNPWTVGIGSVFSREFYELAASRLEPEGIMVQWFHTYEMNDAIVSLVIRTFSSVFPFVEIWDANAGDILLVGALRPWDSRPEIFAKAFALHKPRQDLESISLPGPQAVMVRQLASQRTAFAIAGPGPIQTDDFPLLEYAAPEAFFIGQEALLLGRFDERTWQRELAAPEKATKFLELGRKNIAAVFGTRFGSVNPELMGYMSRASGEANTRVLGGYMSLCVFEATNEVALKPPPTATTNAAAQTLFEAEVALAAPGMPSDSALAQIESLLFSEPTPQPRATGWPADYYACVAAKNRLRRGEMAEARTILLRGLKLAPESEQLGFLARVFAREGILQPSEVPLVFASVP